MKAIALFSCFCVLASACAPNRPEAWNGPSMPQQRDRLTAAQLLNDSLFELTDMSYFAPPVNAQAAKTAFSGSITFNDTYLQFPKEKDYYPGENIFPSFTLTLLSYDGALIPVRRKRIDTRHQSNSYWDVIAGTGKVWYEETDGTWNRASFPLTLTDRWVGQARNCVATFVYQKDSISNVCLQCSQESADIDDQQLGNINGVLPAHFQAHQLVDSADVIQKHLRSTTGRMPLFPLEDIDNTHTLAAYFNQMLFTNAPTSLGAVLLDRKLYLHPPMTRHGRYPYPEEMRHGLYSVTKSMAGALALMFLEQHYNENIFDVPIAAYVPALSAVPAWQGVTFSHALNMVTGTNGGEDAGRLFSTLIAAETAEEAIHRIAGLGDSPEAPGEKFNYASTNYFVLSYAMQKFVEQKEGKPVNYWDLVHEHVLVPIGAEDFSLLHTLEKNADSAIPLLAYGALPTMDEAAKIALLFANEGQHDGIQLISKKRVKEVFDIIQPQASNTGHDYRGTYYRHSFWSKEIDIESCTIRATYMLGFGEHYVVFLPSGAILFRFLDEHDMNIEKAIKAVEAIRTSCPDH